MRAFERGLHRYPHAQHAEFGVFGSRREFIDREELRGAFRTEHRLDVRSTPQIRSTLFAAHLRVLRGEETALGPAHLAIEVRERLFGDAPVQCAAGESVRARIHGGELGIVVEHLLEVGNRPGGLRRVAVETAAELVVDPAECHLVEGAGQHRELLRIGLLLERREQQLERGSARKLDPRGEAAVLGVVTRRQRGDRGLQRGVGGRRRDAPRVVAIVPLPDPLGDPIRDALDLLALADPGVVDAGQHARETRAVPPCPPAGSRCRRRRGARPA